MPSSVPSRATRLKQCMPVIGLLWLSAAVAEPVSVRTRTLGDLLGTPRHSAPATVVARNRPRVAAEIAARVTALPVAVGDRVAANEILARLDCRSHESHLAVARAELAVTLAQLAHAREQLTRARNLKKKKSISEELLDQRQMDQATRQAEAGARREAIKQAEIDVGHCDIRAPFDAVVTERLVSVGAYVSRGKAVVGLLETTGQEVSAQLRETEIDTLQAVDALTFEAVAGRYPLRLRTLLPAVNTTARTREARLTFTGEPAFPGTAGRLVWQGRQALLPADYLVRRQGALGIFVLRDDTARFVAIPGAQEGQPAAVELPADTRLITEGRWRLRDGEAVTVTPAHE